MNTNCPHCQGTGLRIFTGQVTNCQDCKGTGSETNPVEDIIASIRRLKAIGEVCDRTFLSPVITQDPPRLAKWLTEGARVGLTIDDEFLSVKSNAHLEFVKTYGLTPQQFQRAAMNQLTK